MTPAKIQELCERAAEKHRVDLMAGADTLMKKAIVDYAVASFKFGWASAVLAITNEELGEGS